MNCLINVFWDDSFVFEHSLEVSEGGLLMTAASRVYQLGDQFRLSFKLPYSQIVSLQGEVIYVLNGFYGPRQVGIRFLQISSDDRRLIRDYVRRQSTQIY